MSMSQRDRNALQQELAALEAQLENADMLGDEPYVLESLRDEIERIQTVLATDASSSRPNPKKRKGAAAGAGEGEDGEDEEGEGGGAAAAAAPTTTKRRPVVRTMGTYEIQQEIASIQALDRKEQSKNRPRLQALNAELEKRAASGGSADGAGAGNGGRAVPKIHGKAIIIEISSDEEEGSLPPRKKPVSSHAFELDDSSSDAEAAAVAVAGGAGGEGAGAGGESEGDDEDEGGLSRAAAAVRAALGEESVGDFDPLNPGEDPSAANRRTLEHLAKLMQARARVEKVQATLASAVEAVESKIEQKRASFEAEKEAASAEHDRNPSRANQDKRDQFFFSELENANREMIPTKLASFNEEIKRLTDLATEARMVLSTVPEQLSQLTARTQNFMVTKYVRRAFASDPAYAGLSQTDAIDKFKANFRVNSFGRRRVVGLLAFFGNYRRKHPRTRARKIVGKYVRALTLFG